MNRSKDIYGEDANEFKLESWLIDEKNAREMDSYLATVLLFALVNEVWNGT
jgi:hypothetical protein